MLSGTSSPARPGRPAVSTGAAVTGWGLSLSAWLEDQYRVGGSEESRSPASQSVAGRSYEYEWRLPQWERGLERENIAQ